MEQVNSEPVTKTLWQTQPPAAAGVLHPPAPALHKRRITPGSSHVGTDTSAPGAQRGSARRTECSKKPSGPTASFLRYQKLSHTRKQEKLTQRSCGPNPDPFAGLQGCKRLPSAPPSDIPSVTAERHPLSPKHLS